MAGSGEWDVSVRRAARVELAPSMIRRLWWKQCSADSWKRAGIGIIRHFHRRIGGSRKIAEHRVGIVWRNLLSST
jgi:hypothetical protein